MNNPDIYINKIIKFWFNNNYRFFNEDKWFKKGRLLDKEITKKFKNILLLAEKDKLAHWNDTKNGFLAHTILLDQFSRHIYRDTPKAYNNDLLCIKYTDKFILCYINELKPVESLFALMPYQHSEKLIPLVIKNIFLKNPIPIYGNGENIRDWLYVQDHIDAIDLILHSGKINTTYNIGGSNEWKNIDLINLIIDISDKYLKREKGFSNKLKSFVKDRKGHDFRYAIDSKKIHLDLNWKPKFSFKESLSNTVKWYIDRLNLSQK